jgi:glyoxylase-like metal-dependent hydrolase (beta-lactamase superfamily II)
MTFRKIITILMVLIMSIAVPVHAEENDSSWTLTQHYGGGDVGMFYTIKNSADGTHIFIDGGLPENAEYVRQIIDANGGKVDYWFLTHYHADHCGAFNELYPEYRDKIGTIYITPLT